MVPGFFVRLKWAWRVLRGRADAAVQRVPSAITTTTVGASLDGRFLVLAVRKGGEDVQTLYRGTGAEARRVYESSDPQDLVAEIKFYDGDACRGAKR